MSTLHEAALRYAELGYPVFPCAPGTKTPLTEHGHLDATTDPDQIEQWWTQRPNSNVAIATAGLVVIDSDGEANPWPANPEQAADLALAGAVALTPRGGRHYLFRRPEDKAWKCSTGKLAPGVDVRTDGGYIVLPPSVLAGGKAYRWGRGAGTRRLPGPPSRAPRLARRPTRRIGTERGAFVPGHRFAHVGPGGGRRGRGEPDPQRATQRHPGAPGGGDAPGGHVPDRDRRRLVPDQPRSLRPAVAGS